MNPQQKLTPRQQKVHEDYEKALKENIATKKFLKDQNEALKQLRIKFGKSERDVKALSTIGQLIGEVLKKITDEKFIIKTSSGPRYIVGCKASIDRALLVPGTRVTLDLTTLTIMRILPREVDPTIYAMTEESESKIDFSKIGGLKNEIRELKEVIELPIKNPEIFKRVGIQAPKGVLLYGPPGTGKTLLAKAVAATLEVNFLKVVASALIEKYIGESSRMIREMFAYARERAPCIIFLDEIDAIGGKRTSDSSSSDREVQRTLMELLNQLDGFKNLEDVKVIMATNRPDILDPALLRPGRLDRKIEIPLPNETGRKEILMIHSDGIEKGDFIDYDELSKLSVDFNGADLRNVCTEAGINALRDDRDYILMDDYIKAVTKISSTKKLESKMGYKKN